MEFSVGHVITQLVRSPTFSDGGEFGLGWRFRALTALKLVTPRLAQKLGERPAAFPSALSRSASPGRERDGDGVIGAHGRKCHSL
jgi:hypothetical protein